MITCGTVIFGYFDSGGSMIIKNIVTVGEIGVYGYCIGLLMSKENKDNKMAEQIDNTELSKEIGKQPSIWNAFPSKYEGLGAAMPAGLIIGFWFGIGLISAVGVVDGLNYCVGVLMSIGRK